MNRTTIDLWVGIFVALGAVALVFLSLQVASMTSMPKALQGLLGAPIPLTETIFRRPSSRSA